MNYRKHVAYKVSTQDMTLSIDAFSDRFIKPAMEALANYIDTTMLGLYKGIPNQVGTPGTTPSQFYTFAEAQAVLADHGVPQGNRHCVVDPWAQAKMADSFKGLFVGDKVNASINRGEMGGMIAGFNMYTSQNVNTHTCGTAAGLSTMLVDGTSSEGDTTITVDQNGSLAVVATQGDIFTVGSVYGVNPISGTSTGRLRQFVVEAATSSTGNDDDWSCTPGVAPWNIYSASAAEKYLPYQTVDALPADNAAVTVAGTASLQHKVNLSFHRDALGLCMVPLEMPDSASWKARETHKGYSIRVYKFLDGVNDTEYIRFDVLFGIKVLNPFMACRIAG